MDIFDKLNLKWHFPGLDNGEADGFNDPILQYFEGKYERFVAREAIQNSSDARFDNGVPLAVEFEYLQVDAKEIPGLNELKDRINACLSRSVKNDDQKAVRFFDRALKILNQKLVPVLRIGDYNTKGLQGKDDDENGSWYKLVKAIGENRMSGAGDPQEIPDLDQFLPLDDGEGKGMSYDNTYGWNGVQKEESPREISAEKEDEFEDEVEDVVQKFNAIKKTSGMVPITTIDVQVDGGVGGDKNRIVTPGGIEGDKTVGEEKGEVITKINTNNIKYRIVAGRNTDGDLEYCLILNSQIDQNGSLNIIAVGDDNNYPMDIEFAKNWEDNSDFTVNGSRILNLTLEKDKGIKIKLMLKHPRIKYALGIESYEG